MVKARVGMVSISTPARPIVTIKGNFRVTATARAALDARLPPAGPVAHPRSAAAAVQPGKASEYGARAPDTRRPTQGACRRRP